MLNQIKIEIDSFNGIGDLLFVTPTLRRIKERYPDAEVIVNTNYPELLEGNPHVDKIGSSKGGIFLGYADPIHRIWPIKHHIISDYEIVSAAYGLDLLPPDLSPEIYLPLSDVQGTKIGVQVIHKGHWHNKKIWPKFVELSRLPGFSPIPALSSVRALVEYISECPAVICAEGGISHIAKAVGVPAVVIYGGFASPKWNGYKDQINLTNEKHCSFCYNPDPCKNEIERLCMKEITISAVLHAVEGLKKIKELSYGNAMAPIRSDALFWCRNNGLDIGGGRWGLPGARLIENNDWENANKILSENESQDFIFSSHCLEHLEDPQGALNEWIRVLKKGGILYLYLPHPDYLPWRTTANRWHKHDLYPEDVFSMIRENMELMEYVPKDRNFSQKFIWRKK